MLLIVGTFDIQCSQSWCLGSGGCQDEQLQGAPSLWGPGGRLLLAAAHGARCYLLRLHGRLWPGEQILADDRAEAKVLTCGEPE